MHSSKSYFLLAFIFCACIGIQDLYLGEVGYRIGHVTDYKLLRKSNKSSLYQVQCPELDDGRPVKLLNLKGTHYEAGYDYGKLMGNQIKFTYHTFLNSILDTQLEVKLIELFLDWQYQSYVRKQIPMQFIQELKGIGKAGRDVKIPLLKVYFQRVIVISSFPSDIVEDILSVVADQFWRQIGIKNELVESYLQDNFQRLQELIKKFIKKAAIHCSFFATWGSRTLDGQLFTMRNLDWAENTGVNQNKLITIWNIDQTISHLTLGYPGVLGALTGMSAAGITVHEAGLGSHHTTQLGFQWTLRLRYVMMHAQNLEQVMKIWKSTNNTLGMNIMVASANDVKTKHPAIVFETMRGYSAYFHDYDPRENGTIFKDPHTNKNFEAGFSMPEAVFRTNHGYDPIIIDHLRAKLEKNDDSMIRYRILKNGFNWYQQSGIQMGVQESINMTAILGDKGTQKFMSCQNNFRGLNVISVTYQPQNLKMWVAFQYGYEDSFKSACCGVYIEMNMSKWLKPQVQDDI